MLQQDQKVELRKKIRLGENSADKEGYLCELGREKLVMECYENFPEDTILKCSITLYSQPEEFELLIDRTVNDGISYKIYGSVVKNSGIIKKFFRDKMLEQGEKSKQRKSRWKFW